MGQKMIPIIDIFLHLDKYLITFIQSHDILVYFLVFMIIFIETGIVFFPFLPGDSLLFTVGTLAAIGSMNLWVLIFSLTIAAILGDSINYWVGHKFGDFLLSRKNRVFLTLEHLKMTEEFYKKYGNKTIIFARFVPIVRTIAPFIAGMGKMSFPSFFKYNIIGGIVWVSMFIFAGFFFGNIPIVKEQLHWVIIGIIVISIIPIVWKIIRIKSN